MLAEAAGAEISPVGAAFAKAAEETPDILVLDHDYKHQSRYGAYLKACSTWLTISGKTRFEGPVPSCGLPADVAAALRKVAENAAL